MTTDAKSPQPAPKRILIVEDDQAQGQAMSRALVKAGYQVFLAASGAAALLVARELRVDAVVIDLFLPDAGGLGVARAIRETLAAVPVVFVTGLAIAAVRHALAPAPVLFKPFRVRALLTAVSRATGR